MRIQKRKSKHGIVEENYSLEKSNALKESSLVFSVLSQKEAYLREMRTELK